MKMTEIERKRLIKKAHMLIDDTEMHLNFIIDSIKAKKASKVKAA